MKKLYISSVIIPIIILILPIITAMVISNVNILEVFFFLTIIFLVTYYMRKRIEKTISPITNFNDKYYRDIPNIKPAILRYYLTKMRYSDKYDFYATILDLINRNFLLLYKDNGSNIIKINKEKNFDELCKFENNVIELLFDKFNRNELNLSKLKSELEKDELFDEKIDAWKMFVEIDAREYEYTIKNKVISLIKKISSIVVILSVIASYGILLISMDYPISELVYILFIGIAIISINFSNINENVLCQEVVNEIEKGKALGRFFKDYSLINQKDFEAIQVWEGYLVYAIILDIPKKIKKYMDSIFG